MNVTSSPWITFIVIGGSGVGGGGVIVGVGLGERPLLRLIDGEGMR